MTKGPRDENTILVLRHADAGRSHPGDLSDVARTLSKKGERQADALAGLLSDVRVVAVLSSAATRCQETARPLARLAGKEIEVLAELMTGRSGSEALSRLVSIRASLGQSGSLVACTHGDLLVSMLEELSSKVIGDNKTTSVRKAGFIELDLNDGGIASVRVHPPPA